MSWYTKISKDISNIPDAVQYYENEMIIARSECKLFGNIEKLSSAMPGIVEQRFGQLQEIEAILEYLNIELRRLKSQYYRKYLENYQRALSSRECEKFVDGEADVIDFEKIINEFALLRNKWLGITKAFEVKSYALNNIIKLRVAGLDDASL